MRSVKAFEVGRIVIALVNNKVSIKTYYRKAAIVELRLANDAMSSGSFGTATSRT
jgi:SOS-response transcriptional repressor LexA